MGLSTLSKRQSKTAACWKVRAATTLATC